MNRKIGIEAIIKARMRGFSMLELLAVIGIMVLMMGLMVPATSSFMKRTQVKSEAERLASLLRNARQYALANSTHTRVVFADAALEEFTGGRVVANGAYGAFAFYKPILPSGGSDYKPFANADGLTPEFARMPFTSIPSGFVGQFVPLPGSETWRTLDPQTTMIGFVPAEAQILAGYSREFFDEANLLATLETNGGNSRSQRLVSRFYYNPAKFWDPDGKAYYLPNIPNSSYPRNYHQTPYPTSFPLITTRIMPGEPSNFEADGRRLSYDELWSGQAELKYFHEIEEYTGSYKSLGEPDTKSPSNEKKRFFNLKGIEFSPKGLPTLTFADEVIFQFQPKTGRRSPAYDVTIDRNTGLASVRLASEPHLVGDGESGSSLGSGSGIGGNGEGGENTPEVRNTLVSGEAAVCDRPRNDLANLTNDPEILFLREVPFSL